MAFMILITRVNDVYKLTHAAGGAHIDGFAVLKWGDTVWEKKHVRRTQSAIRHFGRPIF